MHGRLTLSSGTRGALCTLLTLTIHGVVALALPTSGSTRAHRADLEIVWLDSGAGATAPGARSDSEPARTAPVSNRAEQATDAVPAAPAKSPRMRRGRPARAERTAARPKTGTPQRTLGLAESAPAATVTKDGGRATPAGPLPDGLGATDELAFGGTNAGGHETPTGGAPVRGPRLLLHGPPCSHHFPANARRDHGQVVIRTKVDAEGHACELEVLRETPTRQGFARAARACAAHLQFAPARDAEDHPVPGHATLELRFDRE